MMRGICNIAILFLGCSLLIASAPAFPHSPDKALQGAMYGADADASNNKILHEVKCKLYIKN